MAYYGECVAKPGVGMWHKGGFDVHAMVFIGQGPG